MKIAGLDIGTTGCKCTVFDENGEFLGTAYRDYPVKRAVSGHEIDVSALMDGVYAAVAEMAAQYPDIAGIGVTSFGEAFVMVDEAGKPMHPAMLLTDPRGREECRELMDKIGADRIAEITGAHPHEMYSISRMMWIKKNRPEIYQAAKHVLLMEDYVVYHLSGNPQIDYSLASRTMAFDIHKLDWSDEIFEAAGIDKSLMSKPVPTGTPAGTVTEEAALKTGLSRDTQIISVSHDQVAAAIGAGAFDGSVAVEGAGTSECLTPIFDTMPDIKIMSRGHFSVVPYVIPGKYVTYAFLHVGGGLVQWCVDNLAKKEKDLAKTQGISVNEYLEQKYLENHGDEPSGLLVLPHFAGAATPYMDSDAQGAIVGLTMSTTIEELYRGFMESIAYEMYLNKCALEGAGIGGETADGQGSDAGRSGRVIHKLHATGGCAKSKVWMQMKADVLNVPITALKTVNAGTVGCAMLTGIAIGVFKDLDDAAAHMIEKTVTYEPRPEMHEKYMKEFARYQKLYDAVRPLV